MTAEALLSAVGGPVAGFLAAVAVYLLGFSLFRELARG